MSSSKQDVTVTTSDEKKKFPAGRSKYWLLFEYKDKFCLVLKYATVSNKVLNLDILSFDLINFNKIGT